MPEDYSSRFDQADQNLPQRKKLEYCSDSMTREASPVSIARNYHISQHKSHWYLGDAAVLL